MSSRIVCGCDGRADDGDGDVRLTQGLYGVCCTDKSGGAALMGGFAGV